MIEIMGVKFLTDKEAADRYGYSRTWFQHQRTKKDGPPFIKITGRGKVLYKLESVDKWFTDRMIERE